MEVFHVVDHLLQTGGDGKTVSVGIGAEERVEDHGLVGILSMKIALHHGKLIQIRQQGEVSLAHNNRSPCCFCIVLKSAGGKPVEIRQRFNLKAIISVWKRKGKCLVKEITRRGNEAAKF